jgi:hypothetical protein
LSIVVRVPFSQRTWALPLLFRLYRNVKECDQHDGDYKKKTQLARELIDVFLTWTPAARIELAADSAYCNNTVSGDMSSRVILFGAMRPDAVLTAAPKPGGKRAGRTAKRGRLLRKPEELARDGRTAWKTTNASLYGQLMTVQYKVFDAQWYRAMGTRLLRIVVVKCVAGAIPYRVYFCTDPTLTVTTILETYATRWGIECFFRDSKQLLGFADSQARKEESVRRVAPLVGLLYTSLVLWFAEGIWTSSIATPPTRPWYGHKLGLCFADVLRAAQRSLVGVDILVLANDSLNIPKPPRTRESPLKKAA